MSGSLRGTLSALPCHQHQSFCEVTKHAFATTVTREGGIKAYYLGLCYDFNAIFSPFRVGSFLFRYRRPRQPPPPPPYTRTMPRLQDHRNTPVAGLSLAAIDSHGGPQARHSLVSALQVWENPSASARLRCVIFFNLGAPAYAIPQ